MRRGMPKDGISWPEISAELAAAKRHDIDWRGGRTTRSAFFVDDALADLSREACGLLVHESGLYPRLFKSIAHLERETVDMALDMIEAPTRADGVFTSGGTESIFLACLAARERAKAARPHIKRPEIVMPFSCHPAFNKAAHYLGLSTKRIQLDGGYRADVERIAAAVGPETIMIVASAVSWPHGTIDPIGQIAAVATEHDVWLHVDACLGGFVLPFLRVLGRPAGPRHLIQKGVCSLSLDFHKYGYSVKGAAALLFSEGEDRNLVGFSHSDWSGGRYVSSGFAGTRSGGPLASAYAAMRYLGHSGYVDLVNVTMGVHDRIRKFVQAQSDLKLLGSPEGPILSFSGNGLPILAVALGMEKRNWMVTCNRNPEAIHLILNPVHAHTVEAYVADLAEVVDEVRNGRHREARGPILGYSG